MLKTLTQNIRTRKTLTQKFRCLTPKALTQNIRTLNTVTQKIRTLETLTLENLT